MSIGTRALSTFGLTAAQREELLDIARQSLENLLLGESELAYSVRDRALEKPAAAFVTITRHGNLRGCVGYTDPLFPLHQTVSRCIRSAAIEDSRFQPVRPEELPHLRIAISVLSALRKVENLEDILVGRDGLQVVAWGRRGLLLPQVATEQGWDREQFLEGVCRKAGLPQDAWRAAGVEIFKFEAEVFFEAEEAVER